MGSSVPVPLGEGFEVGQTDERLPVVPGEHPVLEAARVAARPQFRERLGGGASGDPQGRVREQDDPVAERAEFLRAEQRRASPLDHVHEQGCIDPPGQGRELGQIGRRLDEDHVGSGPGIRDTPLDRGFESGDRQRIGPGDDDKRWVAARVEHGLQLGEHFRERNDVLAAEVAAALGKRLILDLDRGHAGSLELGDRAPGVEGIAEPRVDVGDDRDPDRGHDPRDLVDDFGHRGQADVGDSEQDVGDPCPGGVHGFETGPLDETGGERVGSARQDERVRPGEECPQPGPRRRAGIGRLAADGIGLALDGCLPRWLPALRNGLASTVYFCITDGSRGLPQHSRDQMAERVWDRFLTDQDRAHVAQAPAIRKGTGERPAVLLVDLYRGAFGDRPEPLLEAVRTWPASCGLAGWTALPHIQRLLAAARERGTPVIHISGNGGLPGWRDETPRGGAPAGPEAQERQRRRYDIVDELAPVDGELVIRKIGPSAFWGTPLVGLLNGLGVDTIVVAGESTSGCVRATVVDGRSLRYRVLVPEECVFDRHEATHALNLFDMDQKYADVVPLDEALAFVESVGSWRSRPA